MNVLFLLFMMLSTGAQPDDYPDINEIFPSFNIPNNITDEDLEDSYNNITIDVEKLDIEKFRSNMIKDLGKKIKEEDRLLVNNSRRAPLVYWWDLGQWRFYEASMIQCRQKLVDLMLQFIYMARHKMTQLESSSYFDTEDTGYRVGYLSTKLELLREKLLELYYSMYTNNYSWNNSTLHLVMHHRAVRYSIDFNYYYKVLVRLDGRAREIMGDLPRLAPGQHGGISVEDVIDMGGT